MGYYYYIVVMEVFILVSANTYLLDHSLSSIIRAGFDKFQLSAMLCAKLISCFMSRFTIIIVVIITSIINYIDWTAVIDQIRCYNSWLFHILLEWPILLVILTLYLQTIYSPIMTHSICMFLTCLAVLYCI